MLQIVTRRAGRRLSIITVFAFLACALAVQPAATAPSSGDTARQHPDSRRLSTTARTTALTRRVRLSMHRLVRMRKRPKPRPSQPSSPAPPPLPALPPAPPAPSPPGNPYAGRVGAASHTIWYQRAEQLESLRRARAGGLAWVREDFAWGAFERQPGVWDWSVGDTFMRNAATVGLNVLPVLAYSASWAASGPTIYHPPRDPALYANFAKQLAVRYGPRGTFWLQNPDLTPRPLTAMEIWNEPWHEDFWKPVPDPPAYARLVRAAAEAVGSVRPEIQILVSADIFQGRRDSDQPRDWFRPLLQADPALFRDLVDAYSVHLYVQSRSPHDSTTPQIWRFDRALMTRDLAAAAGASHPLWITEFGWNTYAGHRDSVSEQTQARYVREALEIAHVRWNGLVANSFLYFWGKATPDLGGGYGVLRPDGTAKPVWDVVGALLDVSL
jgi:polysaccharide biosynthesis protein PslG